ncbi:MAG: alpha/beta fold hydrolase [Pseudomonadota bacterium]
MTVDYKTYALGDVELQSGETLIDAFLAYKTYGELNAAGDNAIVLPTFYTGSHQRNEGFFGAGRGIDPAKHFVVSINLIGNGISVSPSNAVDACKGHRFPRVTLWDNIACQHELLTEGLGVRQIALVAGWSMAGCQSYQWAAQYPELVKAILPFCASAKTSPHNIVFLEGVKAALTADASWNGGDYVDQPVAGLRAFGRVYAGWAFSQTFYREGMFQQLGYDTFDDLLDDWAEDHADNWDANNLLAKLDTWQQGDISANVLYDGEFEKALGAIQARAILVPASSDLYFPPEDNAIEARHMPNAELRVYDTHWGHCVANPGNDPEFARFLDNCVNELLTS